MRWGVAMALLALTPWGVPTDGPSGPGAPAAPAARLLETSVRTFPPPEPDTGAVPPRFRIVCHFSCGSLAQDAAAAAEAARSALAELVELPAAPDAAPYRLHLHTSRGFRAEDRRRSGGRYAGHGAFSVPRLREAHVDAGDLSEPSAGGGALRRVAHEAAHLVLWDAAAAAGPPSGGVWKALGRLLGGREPPPPGPPEWASEGAACWAERQAALRLGWVPAPGEDPWLAAHVRRVLGLRAASALPHPRELMNDDPLPHLGAADLYALRSVLFEFLVRTRPALLSASLRPTEAPGKTAKTAKAAKTADSISRNSGDVEPTRPALEDSFADFVDELAASISWRSVVGRTVESG